MEKKDKKISNLQSTSKIFASKIPLKKGINSCLLVNKHRAMNWLMVLCTSIPALGSFLKPLCLYYLQIEKNMFA